uniref:NAC domain-containing protein n=1 Tax=Heterorhabditis bacteriophora TaxID=37862 RepID=A0A1I7X8V2_HETBA
MRTQIDFNWAIHNLDAAHFDKQNRRKRKLKVPEDTRGQVVMDGQQWNMDLICQEQWDPSMDFSGGQVGQMVYMISASDGYPQNWQQQIQEHMQPQSSSFVNDPHGMKLTYF